MKPTVVPLIKHTAYQKNLYLKAAGEVILETAWPTRCALCDTYGTLLCDPCRLTLPYIDYGRICPLCGGPHGSVQCSECNAITLKELGLRKVPYAACVSVTSFNTASARLVTTFKDRNERGLSEVLAQMIANLIPPQWLLPDNRLTISYIPATKKAVRRRGFDHAEMLAYQLSAQTGLVFTPLFERPQSKDQRALSRKERIANMNSRFSVIKSDLPCSVLLVDDVYTTGATLCSATQTLQDAGVKTVYCTTFSRVW